MDRETARWAEPLIEERERVRMEEEEERAMVERNEA